MYSFEPEVLVSNQIWRRAEEIQKVFCILRHPRKDTMTQMQDPGNTPKGLKRIGAWFKQFLSPLNRRILDAGRKLWPGAAIGVTAGSIIFAGILGSVVTTGLGTGADILLSALVRKSYFGVLHDA